ncbi:toll-like receptor 2 [Saccostrea cucullata]|uniref:toll-like receptor 2 n=1 Tax=Saccostrea cuccullata TaxID=36930 RepID=UPI002ED564C6
MTLIPQIYITCLLTLKRFYLHQMNSLQDHSRTNKYPGRRKIIIRNRVKTICSPTSFGEHNKEKLCPMRTACKKLICASPSHLKNKALMDLTESEMCPVPKYSKVLVIAITSCFICVLLVTLIIYKARWHIRYLLYMYRLRRNGYESIAGEEGFDYDAFVIYAEEDQAFVHEILVPTLEDREGYHLCIHYRDFQVGKLIADNIVNSIQKSRKVIVILSNSFAKSKWCDFELIIAQNRLILEQNNLLVVILIEKIEPKNITNSLRLILSTMTYANWNAHGTKGEKASFWNQVRHSFRR